MQEHFLKCKVVRVLAVLALVGVVAALTAYTYLTIQQAKGTYTGATSISISGEGEVLAKPDIGTFSFSVETTGDDAITAQNQGSEVMDAIVAYLEGEGVAETDIKTQYYNLNPKYRYEERVCAAGSYCPPGEPIQDGYQVTQSVQVKVRDLETAGSLISGVGEQGATNISGLSFTIDDESVLKDEARAKAIEDAKAKAVVLAESLGMDLGRLVGFYENDGDTYYYGKGGDMESAMTMSVSVARDAVVPTGENSITSTVTLTYELK